MRCSSGASGHLDSIASRRVDAQLGRWQASDDGEQDHGRVRVDPLDRPRPEPAALQEGDDLDLRGVERRAHAALRLRSRRISRAALKPGMPDTPPPGCIDEPHT